MSINTKRSLASVRRRLGRHAAGPDSVGAKRQQTQRRLVVRNGGGTRGVGHGVRLEMRPRVVQRSRHVPCLQPCYAAGFRNLSTRDELRHLAGVRCRQENRARQRRCAPESRQGSGIRLIWRRRPEQGARIMADGAVVHGRRSRRHNRYAAVQPQDQGLVFRVGVARVRCTADCAVPISSCGRAVLGCAVLPRRLWCGLILRRKYAHC